MVIIRKKNSVNNKDNSNCCTENSDRFSSKLLTTKHEAVEHFVCYRELSAYYRTVDGLLTFVRELQQGLK